MTLTLEIPSDLEPRLRKAARDQGLDPTELGFIAIQEYVNFRAPDPNTESALLQRLNEQGCSQEWWARYKSLRETFRSEQISDSDLAELRQMNELLERQNVVRLECLVKLSKIRGKSVEDLMEELQIGPKRLDSVYPRF